MLYSFSLSIFLKASWILGSVLIIPVEKRRIDGKTFSMKTYDQKVIVATYHNGLFISNTKGSTPLHNTGKDIASIYSDDGKIFYCGLWDGNILVYNYSTNSSREIKAGFEKSPVFAGGFFALVLSLLFQQTVATSPWDSKK